MQPKKILTLCLDVEETAVHLQQAADIASQNNAHLEVLAIGLVPTTTTFFDAEATLVVVQNALEEAKRRAADVALAASQALAEMPHHMWTVETLASCHAADISRLVSEQGRYCDLIVLPFPATDAHDAMLNAALFGAMGRVLMLPRRETALSFDRILLAWNTSNEALAATKAALPILKDASLVKMVIVDPDTHRTDRSDPGGAMLEFLARHGVTVEIAVLKKSLPRVSDVLLHYGETMGADLTVMGAYGHSRFQEAVFGGVTRDMLREAKTPIFTAHV